MRSNQGPARSNPLRRRVAAVSLAAALLGGVAAQAQRPQATDASGVKVLTQGFRDAGRAITGAVDADAVVLPDGRLRMYYGNGSYWTSSISRDGRHWTHEATHLPDRQWGAPDVVRLADGRFRMYFQPSDDPDLKPGQPHAIKSAISPDGINWTVEPGYRLEPGPFRKLAGVGAGVYAQVSSPGVVQLRDGRWLMVASLSIRRGFDPHGFSSSKSTELIVWATSTDGLNFTARGVAIDSRNRATYDGFASSMDPVIWPDGTVRAFFWSPGPQPSHHEERYDGILSTTFTGHGWTRSTPVRTSAALPAAGAAGDGGSDPTSAFFRGRMLLFVGHGGADAGPSHEVLDYSVATSTKYRLTVRTGGHGTVSSGMALGASPPRSDGSTGLRCGSSSCSASLFAGTRVWLLARPARGYRLAGWHGCNATSAGYPPPSPGIRPCWVSVKRATTVTARFVRG